MVYCSSACLPVSVRNCSQSVFTWSVRPVEYEITNTRDFNSAIIMSAKAYVHIRWLVIYTSSTV